MTPDEIDRNVMAKLERMAVAVERSADALTRIAEVLAPPPPIRGGMLGGLSPAINKKPSTIENG